MSELLKNLKCALLGHNYSPHYTLGLNETSKVKIIDEISQCKCCRNQYHGIRSYEK